MCATCQMIIQILLQTLKRNNYNNIKHGRYMHFISHSYISSIGSSYPHPKLKLEQTQALHQDYEGRAQ